MALVASPTNLEGLLVQSPSEEEKSSLKILVPSPIEPEATVEYAPIYYMKLETCGPLSLVSAIHHVKLTPAGFSPSSASWCAHDMQLIAAWLSAKLQRSWSPVGARSGANAAWLPALPRRLTVLAQCPRSTSSRSVQYLRLE